MDTHKRRIPHDRRCPECVHGGGAAAESRRLVLFEAVIELVGWGVQGILDSHADPGWSYTVGLARRELPELTVVGLPPDVAHRLLNAAALRHTTTSPIRPGDVVEGLASCSFVALAVDDSLVDSERFTTALIIEGREVLERAGVVQLVWPDERGWLPWEAGFHGRQNVLGPVPSRLA